MSAALKIEVPGTRPPIITLLAPAGHGKTSLAALFPDPIFIRTEDGMQSIPEDRRPPSYPKARNAEALLAQVEDLCRMVPQPYKTAVLDSVTPLDAMFIDYIMRHDERSPKTINQALGGYGAGMKAVAGLHQKIAKGLQYLNEKRAMTIVVIAHSTIERIDPPDTEGYSKYSIKLAKDSLAPWVDQVDIVAFIQLKKFLKGEEGQKKKAKSYGELEIICHSVAANESKNRYGLTESIDLPPGVNPFLSLIPYYAANGLGPKDANGKPAKKQQAAKKEPEPMTEVEKEDQAQASQTSGDASEFFGDLDLEE